MKFAQLYNYTMTDQCSNDITDLLLNELKQIRITKEKLFSKSDKPVVRGLRADINNISDGIVVVSDGIGHNAPMPHADISTTVAPTKPKHIYIKKTCGVCHHDNIVVGLKTPIKCKICLKTEGKFLNKLRLYVEQVFEKLFMSGAPEYALESNEVARRAFLKLYNEELKIVFDYGPVNEQREKFCIKYKFLYLRCTQPKITLHQYEQIRLHVRDLYLDDIYLGRVLMKIENDVKIKEHYGNLHCGERYNEIPLDFAITADIERMLVEFGRFNNTQKL